jgi:2-methylaconitate cis-trans-isomerase PrpF
LSFLDPEGSKTSKALPTGNAVDQLRVGNQLISASLVDVSNPGIFIDGRDVGWSEDADPEKLNANQELLEKLERIRKEGTKKMGLDPNISSIPKIVLLFAAKADGMDISCQALSMEQAHKAVPVTLALNLGVACKVEGTIPNQLSKHLHDANTVIGHPSGTLEVGAAMEDGGIQSAKLIRTARCHMDGFVNITRGEAEEFQQ